MSEILGSFSAAARTINTWGKYRALGRLASKGTDYCFCCECWSGIGFRVLRRASSERSAQARR